VPARLFLRIVTGGVALLPWRALAPLGALLGWLAGSVLRIRRRAVVSAMTRAGIPEASRAATAMYANLGAGIFELLWLSGSRSERRAQALREHVILDDDLRTMDDVLGLDGVPLTEGDRVRAPA